MSPRDLTPPPPRSPEELDALAEITEDDLLHAEQRANGLATPTMKRILNATAEEPSESPKPRRKGKGRRRAD